MRVNHWDFHGSYNIYISLGGYLMILRMKSIWDEARDDHEISLMAMSWGKRTAIRSVFQNMWVILLSY